MHCIPSSVFHEVQTTQLAIKSFSREVEMVEEMFRGRFTYQPSIEGADKLIFLRTFVGSDYLPSSKVLQRLQTH